MRRVILFIFLRTSSVGGWGMLPEFFFCSLFPVQQTTSGIGHRVFRVGNQYAECEKQQQQQQQQSSFSRVGNQYVECEKQPTTTNQWQIIETNLHFPPRAFSPIKYYININRAAVAFPRPELLHQRKSLALINSINPTRV